MTLEYVWIENYGVVKEQGFNFNPSVFYNFNKETGELSKEGRNEVPIDFFNVTNDTVNNITALVGANGTGKSTVLEFVSGFLAYYRPLGGFVIYGDRLINKSDVKVTFSEIWFGEKPTILDRRDLINAQRRADGVNELPIDADTRNSPSGLPIFGNIINDARVIYFSGEANLQHTNRVYESLLSLSDEYANSYFTDISDIALMATDQNRYRSDKAIYSGENPVLTYRSGESERFIDLMLSEYRNLIPFSLDGLNLGFSFNDISSSFFKSYDEMAFGAIIYLIEEYLKLKKTKISKKTLEIIKGIEDYGLAGFFNQKFNPYDRRDQDENLRIHLYHHLFLRHLREQIMETMGELTERNKLGYFTTLISEIAQSFTTSKSYIEQIKDYFIKTKFASQNTGSLHLKSVEIFYEKLATLKLWEYEKFNMNLSDLTVIEDLLISLSSFDANSGLNYKVSTIFDLDIRGLSTGEKQFLKIFSRFVAFKLNNKDNYLKAKQFIILIDEFEIGFHPLWQQKFLSTWIDFLERFVNQSPENRIKVQLILTSHSPFVVSDLPSQCINFLSKNEDGKGSTVDGLGVHQATFGANIHELFTDSFFLKDGLMGEFARNKIEELIKEIKGAAEIITLAKYETFYKKRVDIIGERFLKTKILELIASKADLETVDSIIGIRSDELRILNEIRNKKI